jgi:hypothetical protein
MIDGTVVNVALPAIGRTFHSGLQTLQWTVTAYTLTLAAFILVGGSIGDHYGRVHPRPATRSPGRLRLDGATCYRRPAPGNQPVRSRPEEPAARHGRQSRG